MEIPDHIAALRTNGDLLAAAAAHTPLHAAVPTCPGWEMRDLLRHIGSVHRWATRYVAERLAEPADSIEDRGGPWPEDGNLVAWFREGHRALVHALEGAPADLACWTFLAAPSPLAHWARRQAHETAIHRVDAESVRGEVTPFPPDFAADGIDELLVCFLGRPGRGMRLDEPRVIRLHAPDARREWWVDVGPSGTRVSDEGSTSDCSVTGAASDLYTLLWNRRGYDDLQIEGDALLLDQWRRSVRVRWS
jgi:uncharacterized protein (TIGR03083 family)